MNQMNNMVNIWSYSLTDFMAFFAIMNPNGSYFTYLQSTLSIK